MTAARLSSLPYELRLGVTGHRSIRDEPGVANAVRRLLDRIATTLTVHGSIPLSWTVVSPLARGADRLVARAVLERNDAHLDVLTPFSLDEYRKDFEKPADLAEFEQLFALRRQFQELDVHRRPGEGPGEPLRGNARDEGYVRVGESVVDTGEILIAIWNGRRAQGLGGTADVVRYAVEHGRVVLWIHANQPDQPPRVIRSAMPTGSEAYEVISDEFPLTANRLSFGYCQQAAYCADTSLSAAAFEASLSEARAQLAAGSTAAGLDPTAWMAAIEPILREYVRADLLAGLYQSRHANAVNWIQYLAGIGVTAAAAQAIFNGKYILIEVAAMIAVLVLWTAGRYAKWHQKWLHDRYLAERLRTSVFTTLTETEPAAETNHSEDNGAVPRDNPLPFYRGPRHWLTNVAEAMSHAAASSVPHLPFAELKAFLTDAWIEDQRQFHAHNAKKKHRSAARRHSLGLGLFTATLVLALIHFLMENSFRSIDLPKWLRDVITLLTVVLPVCAGAIHATTAQLELERIAERSRRMARVLGGIAHRMRYVNGPEDLRKTAIEAANRMKVETHEWWVLLSFQDVRLQA